MSETWHFVCAAEEIDEEDVIGFDFQDQHFAVYNTEKGFFATDGLCTHEAQSLADGIVIGSQIECPLHGACFDIKTGKALTAPASVDVDSIPVKIEGDQILVGLPKSDG